MICNSTRNDRLRQEIEDIRSKMKRLEYALKLKEAALSRNK